MQTFFTTLLRLADETPCTYQTHPQSRDCRSLYNRQDGGPQHLSMVRLCNGKCQLNIKPLLIYRGIFLSVLQFVYCIILWKFLWQSLKVALNFCLHMNGTHPLTMFLQTHSICILSRHVRITCLKPKLICLYRLSIFFNSRMLAMGFCSRGYRKTHAYITCMHAL